MGVEHSTAQHRSGAAGIELVNVQHQKCSGHMFRHWRGVLHHPKTWKSIAGNADAVGISLVQGQPALNAKLCCCNLGSHLTTGVIMHLSTAAGFNQQ
jgi:hypothetical protein